ncbi:hypothetical protein EVG20_g649 [Dentipellis fragilis]|uniref:Uncharacterized protein n=1 Tax=Dentipellis fragilis TaxID=205917 RepID=A0A4Y9ZCY0_9AGAM|nr:hypothetical protein EVG20_g649 [Dentipellis fragilis]
MARRSAPPGSGPAYYTPGHLTRGPPQPDPNESVVSRFFREQIFAPEKLPGNINILTGVGMFVGGIMLARKYGDLLVPA